MNNRTLVYFLFLLLIFGWRSPAFSMVGGSVVGPEDAFKKHVVGIINTADGEICTGTLVRKDLVLTAAHCFDQSSNPRDYIAVFSLTLDPEESVKFLHVTDIKIPREYNSADNFRSSNYDIALMKLAKAAPTGYSPAAVAFKADFFLHENDVYIAAGYGVTKHRNNDPGILRKLSAKATKLAVTGGGKNIELKALGAGPCSGDSGSPLFKVGKDSAEAVSYTLIGVQSQAIQRSIGGKFKNELCEDVGLYTNLPHFRAWLQQNINLPE